MCQRAIIYNLELLLYCIYLKRKIHILQNATWFVLFWTIVSDLEGKMSIFACSLTQPSLACSILSQPMS